MRRKSAGATTPEAASSCLCHMRGYESRSGFTLIEIMVAMLLLLIVMAGLVPLFLQGLSQASGTRYKSVATNVARERMEQIRELDYREIQDGAQLAARFAPTWATVVGDTYQDATTLSGATLTVRFAVEDSNSEGEWLKKVTVEAGWIAPPRVSPAVVTTLIHQQHLGPRGSWLELTNTPDMDPLGTKVLLLNSLTTAKYHLAEADWILAYEDLDPNSPKNIYLRLYLIDSTGFAVNLGDEDAEYEIDNELSALRVGRATRSSTSTSSTPTSATRASYRSPPTDIGKCGPAPSTNGTSRATLGACPVAWRLARPDSPRM